MHGEPRNQMHGEPRNQMGGETRNQMGGETRNQMGGETRKDAAAVAIVLSMRLFLLIALATPALALEVHVSPSGPVNSMEGARDAVRAARKNGDASPARVVFEQGTYPMARAVVFEPRDSGTTYEAAPGAEVIFTGGRKIDGWTKTPDGLWQAKADWKFEGLWVNGRRAQRARTPNEGFLQATGQPTKRIIDGKGEPSHTMLGIDPKAAAPLAGLSVEELRDVNVLVYFTWDVNRHRLAAVRAEDGALQFTGPLRGPFFSLAPFHTMRLENFRAALDAPGEWFLDRAGTLTYQPLPGEEPADVWAPVAEQWMVLRGTADTPVKGLTFRGLHFRHQAWSTPDGGAFFGQAESKLIAAIEADHAREVVFEDCEFGRTMTTAVWFRKGCREITVRKCHLHDLGGGGVKIGDPEVSQPGPDHTSHVLVENTIISGGGRVFPAGVGALIFHASDCTLRHCDIGDFFYSAVSIGWTWGYRPNSCARNVVEYCRLHHLGWAELSDMAAVYTLGPQPGTTIRNCHVHDIGCMTYGGWGLYNDEGSTGIVWENNLVHDTQDGGYHQHYGRGNVIRNNIFAFQKEMQIRRSKPEEFMAFAFEQNIVLFREGRLFGQADKNWVDGRVFVNRNLYWREGGKPFDFAGKSWDEWRLAGNDAEGQVADPLFADPARGDWTLRPGSPALKLGFMPFDWRLAGVTGDAAWRALAARPLPPMNYGTKPKPPKLVLTEDFEGTPVGAAPAKASGIYKKGGVIRVVGEGAAGGMRCLQLTDSPALEPAYEPHFYYQPGHDSGTTRVAFDVKLGRGFHFIHEWRDDASPYRTGPVLDFKDGAVGTQGRKLADLPLDEWVHVEIEAKVGGDRDGTWWCSFTAPGRPAQRIDGLQFANPGMGGLQWLGFIGAGKSDAKCWLDNIGIRNR